MVQIELQPSVASRLDAFLRSSAGADRSDHWAFYGPFNNVRIVGNCAVVRGGFGFDSEYELNFRKRSAREHLGALARTLRRIEDVRNVRKVYERHWGRAPQQTESTQAIMAEHYFELIRPTNVRHYLEIGAGTGYLAARMHQAFASRITIVDLPEILPFSFLYLHRRFPAVDFALPGEAIATFTFLNKGSSVESESVDLAVNTASFQEMAPEEISRYFSLLRRVLRPDGLFFTANREEKIMDGRVIRFDEYPWSPHDEIIFEAPSDIHAATRADGPVRLRLSRLAARPLANSSARPEMKRP